MENFNPKNEESLLSKTLNKGKEILGDNKTSLLALVAGVSLFMQSCGVLEKNQDKEKMKIENRDIYKKIDAYGKPITAEESNKGVVMNISTSPLDLNDTEHRRIIVDEYRNDTFKNVIVRRHERLEFFDTGSSDDENYGNAQLVEAATSADKYDKNGDLIGLSYNEAMAYFSAINGYIPKDHAIGPDDIKEYGFDTIYNAALKILSKKIDKQKK